MHFYAMQIKISQSHSLNSTKHTTYPAPAQTPITHQLSPGQHQNGMILFMLWKQPPGGSEKGQPAALGIESKILFTRSKVGDVKH